MRSIIYLMLLGLIPSMIAARKGRNAFLWWVYGALLFVIALPHALLVGPYVAGETGLPSRLDPKAKTCPRCDTPVTDATILCPSCTYPLHYRPQGDGAA